MTGEGRRAGQQDNAGKETGREAKGEAVWKGQRACYQIARWCGLSRLSGATWQSYGAGSGGISGNGSVNYANLD